MYDILLWRLPSAFSELLQAQYMEMLSQNKALKQQIAELQSKADSKQRDSGAVQVCLRKFDNGNHAS